MNELNLKMKQAVENYCNKNQLIINKEEYGKYYYIAYINNNQEIICNIMENVTSNKNLSKFYMKSKINGKQKRISKKDW